MVKVKLYAADGFSNSAFMLIFVLPHKIRGGSINGNRNI